MKPFFAPWTVPGEKPLVRFDNVTKRFGTTAAVDQLSLDIYEREFLALSGRRAAASRHCCACWQVLRRLIAAVFSIAVRTFQMCRPIGGLST